MNCSYSKSGVHLATNLVVVELTILARLCEVVVARFDIPVRPADLLTPLLQRLLPSLSLCPLLFRRVLLEA